MGKTEEQQHKRELREKYEVIYAEIRLLLFRYNPIGIIFKGNLDEYDPEISTILPRLKDARGEEDVLSIVYEEFVRWFGNTAGSISMYRPIATEIWTLWKQYMMHKDI